MTLSNQLATSTSPYLLQHASNPVQWYPWGEEALTKAQQEDKPILLSIGYAACHWCHVMAHESFEDKEIATIMNAHFINIKVDREENPAIDQVAIEAVQRMGLQAGWPLHVFLTPNQQPFYGGTYFPPKVWKQLLTDISSAFKNHREEILKSSSYFTESLHTNELKNALVLATDVSFTAEISQQIFQKIYQQLDHHQGGTPGSPKFFMPSIHAFLLDYHRLTQEQKALHQLNLTLTHIACGGIYDHLGGGFYRYSTDETWTIPHFEKMLYDNAQLLSLYAHAYTITKNPFYKQTIEHTIGFIEREMLNQSGGFHSSLDADSEGIEGAFYTWTYAEIEKLLEEDMVIFSDYYNITKTGNWHNGLNILYRNPQSLPDILDKHQADIEEKLARAKQIVYTSRYTTRPKPALNDQVIASWNGMMLQALVNIYYALGDEHFLELALKNATYIREHFIQRAQMWHSHSQGKQGRTGYLEDYAWVAKAFISLYEATLQEDWLYQAEQLVQYVFKHFNNSENDLFYFTDIKEPVLIKRTQEIFDQVTPSSNAVIAHALYLLGRLLNQEVYIKTSEKMLFRIYELLQQQPLYMAHWASLYLLQLHPPLLVTITGPDGIRWGQTIKQHHPEILVAGKLHNTTSSMLILPSTQEEKAAVYICSTRACHATLYSLDEALLWLKDWMLNQRA